MDNSNLMDKGPSLNQQCILYSSNQQDSLCNCLQLMHQEESICHQGRQLVTWFPQYSNIQLGTQDLLNQLHKHQISSSNQHHTFGSFHKYLCYSSNQWCSQRINQHFQDLPCMLECRYPVGTCRDRQSFRGSNDRQDIRLEVRYQELYGTHLLCHLRNHRYFHCSRSLEGMGNINQDPQLVSMNQEDKGKEYHQHRIILWRRYVPQRNRRACRTRSQ